MDVIFSKEYDKELRKFLKRNIEYKEKVKKTIVLLISNKNYPSLRLHKLSGSNNYSISVDMNIRIIFRFKGGNIFLLRIGNHDEIY
jgi:mRNA-degrading endonuclease YafQ of YafQ-DinJ toxin-antitoxin module